MGLYYAVTLFGEQLGIESAGSRYFGLTRKSVVQSNGATWTGIFLVTICCDAFYVCFMCKEGARLRLCNVGLMLALTRFTLQVSHSCPSLRGALAHGTNKEFLPGIIASFVFILLFSSASSRSTLPAGRKWYSATTTTAKSLLISTFLCFMFVMQYAATNWTTQYKGKVKIGAAEFAQADWCINMMSAVVIHAIFALSYLTEDEQSAFAKVRVGSMLACLYQGWQEKSIVNSSDYKQSMLMMTAILILNVFTAHNKQITEKLKLA